MRAVGSKRITSSVMIAVGVIFIGGLTLSASGSAYAERACVDEGLEKKGGEPCVIPERAPQPGVEARASREVPVERAPQASPDTSARIESSSDVQSSAGVKRCAALRDYLKRGDRDRRALSRLLAPDQAPTWRYRTARRKMFSEVAPQLTRGSVEALYTGRVARPQGRKAPGGFNCEHLWPRAWMSGKRSSRRRAQESDIHNLYPSEIRVNSRRGHLPFGEVQHNRYPKASPSKIGPDARGVEVVEPRDEYKGDVARTILYMAARWNLPLYHSQSAELLVAWSKRDLPSATERRRDELITGIQGNPNPLVTCPELAEPLSRLIAHGASR